MLKSAGLFFIMPCVAKNNIVPRGIGGPADESLECSMDFRISATGKNLLYPLHINQKISYLLLYRNTHYRNSGYDSAKTQFKLSFGLKIALFLQFLL